MPGVQEYRGLSGIDSAVFGLLVAYLIKHGSNGAARVLAICAVILFLAKIAWEMIGGQSVFAASAGVFHPYAGGHLIGAGAGLAVGMSTAVGRDSSRRFATSVG